MTDRQRDAPAPGGSSEAAGADAGATDARVGDLTEAADAGATGPREGDATAATYAALPPAAPSAASTPAPDDEPDATSAPPRLLEPREIRARRRPRAILLVWTWELAGAYLVATPIHAWARKVWGAHPDGDAVLFRPGGHALLSWLGDEGAALAVVLRTAIVTIAALGILGQLVTGALVASLATGIGDRGRPAPTSFALRAGAGSFFPLLGIGVLAGAIEGAVLGVGLFASSALDHALQPRLGDARAFTARLALLALFVVATLAIGVVADLARVTVARDIAGELTRPAAPRAAMLAHMRAGVVAAVTTARRALGRASLAWGWRAAASMALIYAGAVAGDLTGERGGGALWLLFAFHQLVVLARAGLRASWLANALRLVGR